MKNVFVCFVALSEEAAIFVRIELNFRKLNYET